MAPTVPPLDIWHLLFERLDRPFPDNHGEPLIPTHISPPMPLNPSTDSHCGETKPVIFRSSTSTKAYKYHDAKAHSEHFGRALRAHWNWAKRDVLLLMAPNHIDTPIVTWGTHYAGGIVAPVNPALSPEELQGQISSSAAKAIVVHSTRLSSALRAAEMCSFPQDRILVMGGGKKEGLATIEEFMRDATPMIDVSRGPTPLNAATDTAFLVYSSGTTGRPKGVMVSHQNVVADVVLQAAIEGAHVDWRRDRTLAVLPIYHIYGLVCLAHLTLYLGTTTIFMEKFEIRAFCALIQEHRISHAYVAPPIVLHLAKNRDIDGCDLSSLRMLTSGGAPLAAALINEAYQRWGVPVRQAYGLSETTSVSHIQRWENWQGAIGSSGPPLPGLEARIVLPNGTTAPTKGEGELWIRGPSVFNGYMDNPTATAECLTSDHWFKTGDIGYVDERENLYITDRAKDMIKFKGYAIAPTELEDVLLDHPGVDDAAVIGVWNEEMQTEVPLGYIVLKVGVVGSTEVAKDIQEGVKRKLVHYKHLRGGVVWIEQIPKSASGKILKRELRERAGTVDKDRRVGAVEYTRYRAKI